MKKRRTALFAIVMIITSFLFSGCQNKEKAAEIQKTSETNKETETKAPKTTKKTDTPQATEAQKTTEQTNAAETTKITESPPITKETETPVSLTEEIYNETSTTVGYVLSVEGSIMYLDEVNTGGRTAPGEGKDRATAYDLINAVINSPGGVRTGLTVDVTYYIEDGMNKALEVNSDGDEKEPMMPYELRSEIDSNTNVN